MSLPGIDVLPVEPRSSVINQKRRQVAALQNGGAALQNAALQNAALQNAALQNASVQNGLAMDRLL